jgi:hypothetical protein
MRRGRLYLGAQGDSREEDVGVKSRKLVIAITGNRGT